MLVRSFETTTTSPYSSRERATTSARASIQKLIPKFIHRASKGKSLPVYGDGSNVREWIYVKDNCRALDLALREGDIGEGYNIGSHEEKTNLG